MIAAMTVRRSMPPRTLFAALAALFLGLTMSAFAQAEPLRVMTFNVRVPVAQDGPNAWPERKALLGDVVAAAAADVVGTQELTREQGDYLLERLPGYAWFGIGRRGGRDDEHMGNFYRRDRLRLVEWGNFWLSDSRNVPGSISWGNLYPRMVTWGLFETAADGRRFYLLNTHFPYRPQDEAARTKAADAIVAHIATLPAGVPVVLTGDFNTRPDSPAHAALSRTLTDAWTSAPEVRGPDGTFHGFRGEATRRIDWILARGLSPLRIRTDTTARHRLYPSDHFPVIAEFDW